VLDWMRPTVAFAGMELKRFLRTSQLWTHIFGPFVGLPALALIFLGQAMSTPLFTEWLVPPLRVAVDGQAPPELELDHHFEQYAFEVVLSDDPVALLDGDGADVAVVDWRAGDGLGTRVDEAVGPFAEPPRRPDDWLATSWRWRVTVLAHDTTDQDRVDHAIEAAGNAWLEDQLAAYALDPATAERPWGVHTIRPHQEDGGDRTEELAAALIFIVGTIAALAMTQLLAVLPLGDRRDGITETWLASATPPFAIVCGRMLAAVVLTTLLVTMGIVGSFGALPGLLDALHPAHLITLPTMCCLVLAAALAPVGLYSPSVSTANNVALVSWAVGGGIIYGLSRLPPGLDLLGGLVVFLGTAWLLGRVGALGRPLDAEAEG